jgi:uncharacterized membrane protein
MKMLEITKFKLRDWLLLLVLLLFLTDLSIIFNIPNVRPALSFLFFTFIPGFLILQILRLNKINLLQKIVLWVGVSVSFLMIIGIILNIIYPFLIKPLSLTPVLITLNIFILLLSATVYWRNSKNFNIKDIFNYKFTLEGKIVSLMIFPFIFPLLAVLGTYLMNISQNNILLLTMLLLIPVYLITVVYMRDRIHSLTYPLAVWLIGLSLLLMYGLTSYHLIGIDVHLEYYCFQLTQYSSHWDLNAYYNPFNACLSITILPQIYQVLSGLSGEYVFKLFMALIGSVSPLIVYLVARKYLARKYAFLGALLFIFQLFFMGELGAVRQEIATVFFFLAVLVLFDFEMDKRIQKLLILLFLFATLISHYSTAYVAFILVLPILLWPFFDKLIRERRLVFTNFDIILISLVMILIWYILVAKVQFASGAQVVAQTVQTASTGGAAPSALVSTRSNYVLGILGVVLTSLPNTVSVIVNDLIIATILVGLLGMIAKLHYFHEKFKMQFLIGISISLVLLVSFVTLPYISIAYDAVRLFFQLVIFLAPVFVIGGIVMAKVIKKPKWDVYFLLILLLLLFSCSTYLQYSLLGMPYSPEFENNSMVREELFIYNSELTSAQWINQNRVDNLTIYSDENAVPRFSTAYGTNIDNISINDTLFGWDKMIGSGYIYLGYANVNDQAVIELSNNINKTNITSYSNLFISKSRIYDNGGSQIWW